DYARCVRPEGAGHAGVEGADGKGKELVGEDVDAHGGRRPVVVADGRERTADAGAEQVEGGEDREHRRDQHHVVEEALPVQHKPPEGRLRDGQIRRAAAAAVKQVEGKLEDDLGGQGGQGQVQAFHPERGYAEKRTGRGRDGTRNRDREPEGQAGL